MDIHIQVSLWYTGGYGVGNYVLRPRSHVAVKLNFRLYKEALAIRRVFSLVGMIKNTKFSNCTHVFKIGAVRQQNMQSKHQNTFQSNLSLAK